MKSFEQIIFSCPLEEVPLDKLLEEKKITNLTITRIDNAKKIIERKYNMIKLKELQQNILKDKLKASSLPQSKKNEILEEINKKLLENLRKKYKKLTIFDYTPLSLIGKGAFGLVYVCKNSQTNEIVAIKKFKKTALEQKNQIRHTLDEQDYLSKINSPWIVDLKASFQEGDYLYLVMEFLAGGDLMGLLIERDIFTEDEARFYICEIILAVDTIHSSGCLHRDIKPDNILIDKNGHIKFSDFGLAKLSNNYFVEDLVDYYSKKKTKHSKSYSCVGTAYYVAPEVLQKKGYGPEIDWWSIGVILFEMLAGYAPFCSQKAQDVLYKVTHFEDYLKFPKDVKISETAKDLIRKLVTTSDKRLGLNGSGEIKSHPFFRGVNWSKIREITPPFIPNLKSDYDTHYFNEVNAFDTFYPNNPERKHSDCDYISYNFPGKIENPLDLENIIQLIRKKNEEYKVESEKKNSSNKLGSPPSSFEEKSTNNESMQNMGASPFELDKDKEKIKVDINIKSYDNININNNNSNNNNSTIIINKENLPPIPKKKKEKDSDKENIKNLNNMVNININNINCNTKIYNNISSGNSNNIVKANNNNNNNNLYFLSKKNSFIENPHAIKKKSARGDINSLNNTLKDKPILKENHSFIRRLSNSVKKGLRRVFSSSKKK